MDPGSCCTTEPAAFVPQPEADQRLATLCHALGHPHRVFILRFLVAHQACFAGEIADQLPIAASTVSQHLTHLKRAGLIKGEVHGPRRCYCIDPVVFTQLKSLFGGLDDRA